MRQFRRPWIWLARLRHRKGYGVHSPFAYDFIRGVVYERERYYAYERLSHHHSWPVRAFGLYPQQCCRMLFRVANYAHPDTFRLIGSLPVEREYVRAAVPSARELSDGVAQLVLVSADACLSACDLMPQMPDDGVMVVEGIHDGPSALQQWHSLQDDEHSGITFDLYDYGIIFFDHSRHKQHYIVNF